MKKKDIGKNSLINCESLWARNKYLVLSKSHKQYIYIREYLKNDSIDFDNLVELIELAKNMPESKKDVINSFKHIWGYFKRQATFEEKEKFFILIDQYSNNIINKEIIVEYIKNLLEKYPNDYIKNSTLINGEKL